MEQAASEGGSEIGDYKPVDKPDMTFEPGTYRVSLAADGNHEASLPTEIVGGGPKLKVSLPAEQTGYTLTADEAELDWQGSAKLSFELADGYAKGPSFAIKADGAAISPNADGTYSLSNAEADVAVAVEGVAPKLAQEVVYDASSEDSHNASLSGMLSPGATFSAVPLAPGDEAYDALSKIALAAGRDVVSACEAKLTGDYEGRLKASFKVGGAYEGRTLTVYHRKAPGDVEELRASVLDGWASVEVDGLPLAPLALAALASGAALVAFVARKARRR